MIYQYKIHNEELKNFLDHLNHFLARVNGITSYHRHKIKIPKKKLDNLSNAQIDMEERLKQLKERLEE